MPIQKRVPPIDTCIRDQATASSSAPEGSQRLGYSVSEFAVATGIGRSKLYEAILDGQLTARKFGRRTIILREDAEAWLKSLPHTRVPPQRSPASKASR